MVCSVVYGEEENLRIDVRPGMHGCMHIDRHMTCVTAFLRARHPCSLFYCFSYGSWIKSKKVWRMISCTSGPRHVTLRMHITLTAPVFPASEAFSDALCQRNWKVPKTYTLAFSTRCVPFGQMHENLTQGQCCRTETYRSY